MVFHPSQGRRHSWTGSEGVICLRALWEMETDPVLRDAYAQGLRASAELAAKSLPLCREFNVNGTEHFEHDWRVMNQVWKPQHSEAEVVEVAQAGLRVQGKASPRMVLEKNLVREPCFAAWVVTLCPDAAFVAQHREAILEVITHYRYDRLYMSQFFPVESAWYRLALAAATKPARGFYDELAAQLEPTRTVVYKKIGGRELRLSIFEPPGFKPGDKRPCFLSIHGGGWTGMTPRRQYPVVSHFAKCGMVGISVEYRLFQKNSGTTVFDCVKDARSAMRYVRSHAAELGIDPQKIVANGGSAGGHLAAGLALFDGVDEAGEDTSVSCMPNALVLFYPVIDTSPEGYGHAKIGERWQELSPLHRVKPGVPPTIIFHGTGDTTTPFKGAKAFHEAMLKAGNRCELVVHEGGKHGHIIFDPALWEDALRRTGAFLQSLGLLESPKSQR